MAASPCVESVPPREVIVTPPRIAWPISGSAAGRRLIMWGHLEIAGRWDLIVADRQWLDHQLPSGIA